MSKFRGNEQNGFIFVTTDDYEIDVNQETMTALLFRNEEWFDRITVLDDRDNLHFSYWRDQIDHDVFEQVIEIAWFAGTVLLRDSAPQAVVEHWEKEHQITDVEFNEFFGEGDEPRTLQ